MHITFSEKPCRRCKRRFQPVSANHRYCSEACQRGLRTCRECGREFVRGKKAKGLFCSRECYYEHTVPTGTRKPMNGYMVVKVAAGTPGTITRGATMDRWMFEHRHVMQ